MPCPPTTAPLLVVASGLLAPLASADVNFSDTEFVQSTWGFETAVVAPGGTAAPTQVASGNPGFARQITTNVSAGGAVYGFNRFGTSAATRYDPLVDGAILSVDFSLDSKWHSATGGTADGQWIAFGAKQGQTLYFASPAFTGTTGSWNTLSASGLTAASFLPLTTGTAINFTATGDPIRFGFVTGITGGATGYTSVALFDNFSAAVHNVPAPSAACSLAFLAGALSRRRRTAQVAA